MKLITRTKRAGGKPSERPVTTRIEFTQNWGGQGGSDYVAFEDKKRWYLLVPESEADVKELMRQAHCLHHNFQTETEKAKASGRAARDATGAERTDSKLHRRGDVRRKANARGV